MFFLFTDLSLIDLYREPCRYIDKILSILSGMNKQLSIPSARYTHCLRLTMDTWWYT